MEESGERTIMSAPMPRVRIVVSSTKPRLSPTSVSMRVTGTPISRMLNKERLLLSDARCHQAVNLVSIVAAFLKGNRG